MVENHRTSLEQELSIGDSMVKNVDKATNIMVRVHVPTRL
eukprot:SAG11_NODE_6530_length_1294_cov_0.685356_4_plen_40_part_00